MPECETEQPRNVLGGLLSRHERRSAEGELLAALGSAVAAAATAGRRIRSVMVTLPDNPTGRLASPATLWALCQAAAAHQLVIISDEIYRDLLHDPATPVLSPAEVAPQATVVTTGLSKSLALGGWRLGAARLPDGPLGDRLCQALFGGSEIWSAVAFTEPPADPGHRCRRHRHRLDKPLMRLILPPGTTAPACDLTPG